MEMTGKSGGGSKGTVSLKAARFKNKKELERDSENF